MTNFLKYGSTYVPSDTNAVIAVICTFLRVLSEFSYVLNIESSENRNASYLSYLKDVVHYNQSNIAKFLAYFRYYNLLLVFREEKKLFISSINWYPEI